MKNYLVISILFFLSGGAMISCAEGHSGDQTTPTQTLPANKPSTKPALGIEIPKLVFADDVKKYMRDIIAAPLPSTYILPADILAISDYEKAVAKVNEHFPQFVGLENEALLRAVKANPALYQDMMLEARNVREHFFPGSQPKQKQ